MTSSRSSVRPWFWIFLLVLSTATATETAPTSLADPTPTNSTCDRLQPLPEECDCTQPQGPFSLVVTCLKPFQSMYFNDTIGVVLTIDPCNPVGASISLDVTEEDHQIDYVLEDIRAGEERNFPIPGLSVIVPGIGHVGIDVTVDIAGNIDQLLLKVGLNACVVIRSSFVCASSIPGLDTIFPWWILSGTYSFGDMCGDHNQTLAPVWIEEAEEEDDEEAVLIAVE